MCLALVEGINKWHCYLRGTHFTLVTTHAALEWLKCINNPSGRLSICSLKLSMYDVGMKHVKGGQNVETDALSHSPVTNLVNINDTKDAQNEIPDGNVSTENVCCYLL